MDKGHALLVARLIANVAHAGQVDKAGLPYITHPTRVAQLVREISPADTDAETVAWLHDVVEDSAITLDDLRRWGLSVDVVAAVDAITRRSGEDPDVYYARVAASPRALQVKIADIADNCDPARLALLDPATRDRLTAKYDYALAVLARLAPTGV